MRKCGAVRRVCGIELRDDAFVVAITFLDMLALCLILVSIKFAGSGLFQGKLCGRRGCGRHNSCQQAVGGSFPCPRPFEKLSA